MNFFLHSFHFENVTNNDKSRTKQDKWTLPSNLAYCLFGPNFPKKGISSPKEKISTSQIQHIRICLRASFQFKRTILFF